LPVHKAQGLQHKRPGAVLKIRVTPRAQRDEIVAILADRTIKIRLTAPPVEGKANHALIEFLARVLSVPRSKIGIRAGGTGRDKLVSIQDMESSEAQVRILEQLRS
jgi:hypothetical protein